MSRKVLLSNKEELCPRAVRVSACAEFSLLTVSSRPRRKLRNESSAADSLSTLVDLIRSGATVCEREVSWRTRRSHRLDRAPTRRCDLENFHHADRSAGPCLAAALVEAGSIWKPQRQGYQFAGRRRECAQWSELTQGKPPRLARHCRRCARRRAPPVVRWSWRCTSLTLTHGHSRHASAVACPSRPNVLRMALRSTSASTTSRVRAEPGTAAGAPIQQTSGTSRRTSHSSTCGGAAE